MISQKTIRQEKLSRRANLTPQQVELASQQIAEQLFKTRIFQQSKTVACYLSVKNEVATDAIIEKIFQENKKCYLLKISETESGIMQLVEYEKNSTLIKNRFGILEPAEKKILTDLSKLDLLIAPLVAFDKNNNRIGMGAGYYDRLLQGKQTKPFYLGLAYAFQETERIEAQAWDVVLDQVLIAG
jgi:5-formyltetrahydrofolate cyclo-ligase